jgi:hypothetical protein
MRTLERLRVAMAIGLPLHRAAKAKLHTAPRNSMRTAAWFFVVCLFGVAADSAPAPSTLRNPSSSDRVPVLVEAVPMPRVPIVEVKIEHWKEGFDATLAVGTVLLAIATIGLWRSTQKLVVGADQTARLELRAYVNVSDVAQERLPFKDTVVVSVHFTNFGRTPAYKVECWAGVQYQDPPGDGHAPVGNELLQGPWTLGANAVMTQGAETPKPVPIELERRILEGNAAIVVFGQVRYEDVFGAQHETKFKLATSKFDYPHGRYKTCLDGNKST